MKKLTAQLASAPQYHIRLWRAVERQSFATYGDDVVDACPLRDSDNFMLMVGCLFQRKASRRNIWQGRIHALFTLVKQTRIQGGGGLLISVGLEM